MDRFESDSKNALFVLAVTSPRGGFGRVAQSTEGAMTMIARKLSKLNFLGGLYGQAGGDLESLSDRALKDIGFRLDGRDLSYVKPFWQA
jgi:hypothetical protein